MLRCPAVLALLLALACSKSKAIGEGAEVQLKYALTVDGAAIDSSEGKPPFVYKQGAHMIVPGLEAALAGHKTGDKFAVRVAAKDGYGDHLDAGVKTVPYEAFGGRKNADKLKPGEMVSGQANGRPFQAKVVRLDKAGVVLDLNHPLAGKTLDFAVEVLSVKP